jgi:hypothetical protein
MPYNNPIKKKSSSCMQMKDYKGKPVGLMMEGSVNHMSMLHQEEGPSKRTQRIRDKRKKLDEKFLDNEISDEKYARKDDRLIKRLEKSKAKDKESAVEMSPYKMSHGDSPNKMSPLNDNHPGTDPRTGERKLQPFVDVGAPEGFESSMGENYDEEQASRIFVNAQNQALNALDLASRQLGGEEVFHKMIPGLGSTSLTGPQAAQIITGYSAGEEGKETVGGGGKVRFNRRAVENKLDELKKLAITDPVAARSYISKRISVPLGDVTSKFRRYVDPLKRNKK